MFQYASVIAMKSFLHFELGYWRC